MSWTIFPYFRNAGVERDGVNASAGIMVFVEIELEATSDTER